MSWENRNGCGRYYTRSKRRNGKIVREYVGTGILGELAAELDCEVRRQRAADARQLRVTMDHDKTVDDQLDACCEIAELISGSVMLGAGYHHHRGAWRKRRATKNKS